MTYAQRLMSRLTGWTDTNTPTDPAWAPPPRPPAAPYAPDAPRPAVLPHPDPPHPVDADWVAVHGHGPSDTPPPGTPVPRWHADEAERLALLAELTGVHGCWAAAHLMDWST